jgi:hypothetical protein
MGPSQTEWSGKPLPNLLPSFFLEKNLVLMDRDGENILMFCKQQSVLVEILSIFLIAFAEEKKLILVYFLI